MCQNKYINNNNNKLLLLFTQDLTAPVTGVFENIAYRYLKSLCSAFLASKHFKKHRKAF